MFSLFFPQQKNSAHMHQSIVSINPRRKKRKKREKLSKKFKTLN